MTGKSILFCGPSGSGKTTIVHHLLKKNPRLKFSVSATTRAKRENETDGVDYHFLSVDDFKNRISEDAFVEWEEVYKNGFYGTLKSEVEKIWSENKVVAFDVDVEGGLNIKKKIGENILTVFVMPPSVEELHKRIHARGTETPESFEARVKKAEHELTYANLFDQKLVNVHLEKTFVEAERMVNEFLES